MSTSKKLGITLDGTEYIVTVREIKEDIADHITGISPTEYDSATGSPLEPTVLTDGTVTLNTDYTVQYTNNTWPGTATATITGIDNYEGSISFNFTIAGIDISSRITGIDPTEAYYTGSPITPTVIDDGTVIRNTDYTVSYSNNTNVGTGTVTVTGIRRYVGSRVFSFTIKEKPYINSHITGVAKEKNVYTGEEIEPGVVTDGTVEEDIDYMLSYANNINIGLASVTASGEGNYQGAVSYNFKIVSEESKDVIAAHVTGIDPSAAYYTGEEIKPTVLTDGTVTETTDYTVEYKDNKEIGTGKVVITGANTYEGSVTYEFDILARPVISDHVTGIDPTTATYTGEEIKPTVLTDGTVVLDTDYTVEYSDNINVGTGKVTVKAAGVYTGSAEYTFTIEKPSVISHITGIDPISATYTGEEIKPTVNTDGTVVENTDYSVYYSDNTKAGTGKVTVTGINSYGGTHDYEFTINPAAIGDHIVGIDPITADYTGEEIKPSVVDDGEVVLNTDYSVSYTNNVNVGTGKVTVTGTGNYGNSEDFEFTIEPVSIKSHITGINPTSAYYTGESIKPAVVTDGKVVETTDYTVAYTDNINVGTGKVTVTGTGNYDESTEYEFSILEKPSIEDHITGINPTTTYYTGSEIKPAVITDGTVTETTDYTVAYTDNINVGTGKVTVTGAGNYQGSVEYEFTIAERTSIKSHITGINPTSADETGDEIKPEVLTDGTVTLNTDFSVEYKDNIEPGTGKVIITGIGAYNDSTTYEFTINAV